MRAYVALCALVFGCGGKLAGPDLLLSGQPQVFAVAQREVVFQDGAPGPNAIRAMATDGRSPHSIAAVGDRHVFKIVAEGVDFFWLAGDDLTDQPTRVMRAPRAGGPPVELQSATKLVDFAVDSERVYFLVSEDSAHPGAILSQPRDGGSTTPLARGLDDVSGNLVAHGGMLFWAGARHHDQAPTEGMILSLPTTGGAATVIASNVFTRSIAVDDVHLYFTKNLDVAAETYLRDIFECPITGCGDNNANARLLAANQPDPVSLAVDGTALYWANRGTESADVGAPSKQNSDGAILKLSFSDVTPVTLASGLLFPNQIVVDETSLYWLSLSRQDVDRVAGEPGQIYKIPAH
jgi:hypothetical protein